MKSIATIARPYSAAAFLAASEQGTEAKWAMALEQMGRVVITLKTIIEKGHFLSPPQMVKVILECVPLKNNDSLERFVNLLAESQRLFILPAIAEQFQARWLQAQDIVALRVETAFPIEDTASFDTFLREHLGKEIQVIYEHNPNLLGGVRVYIHDDVIDASILGRLQRMQASLKV